MNSATAVSRCHGLIGSPGKIRIELFEPSQQAVGSQTASVERSVTGCDDDDCQVIMIFV
jgi:hypothetical protein